MPSRSSGALVLIAVAVSGLLVHRWSHRTQSAGRSSLSGEELSVLVAQMLVKRFIAKSIVTSAGGGALRVGEHALAVRASLDYVKAHEGKFYVGLDVRCFADGTDSDALHSGSMGIGETADAALRTAVGEWVLQYGTPIVGALHGQPEVELLLRSFRAGRFVVYPGPTGFRGESPQGPKTGFHEELFRTLDASLNSWISPQRTELHAMTLTLDVRDGVVTSGECRLDGAVSDRLYEVAKEVAWPRSPTPYILKQYYVLTAAAETH